MKLTVPCLLLALLVPSLHESPAQDSRKGKAKDNAPLPLQGKTLPEVSAHTEKGDLVSLRQQLKGKHGVIVFGCLT